MSHNPDKPPPRREPPIPSDIYRLPRYNFPDFLTDEIEERVENTTLLAAARNQVLQAFNILPSEFARISEVGIDIPAGFVGGVTIRVEVAGRIRFQTTLAGPPGTVIAPWPVQYFLRPGGLVQILADNLFAVPVVPVNTIIRGWRGALLEKNPYISESW